MGRNKALMQLAGKPLIARVLDRLARLCDELIISADIADDYSGFPARVVPDLIPGRGVLSGVHAGLRAMRSENAIVTACDMPFLSLALLRFMATLAVDHDVVVPRLGGYYEPLHAIYGVQCIAPLEQLMAAGPGRVVAFFDRVRVREVGEQEVRLFSAQLSFFNVNTPDDWARAQQLSELGFS